MIPDLDVAQLPHGDAARAAGITVDLLGQLLEAVTPHLPPSQRPGGMLTVRHVLVAATAKLLVDAGFMPDMTSAASSGNTAWHVTPRPIGSSWLRTSISGVPSIEIRHER
jgi:hypothetical protein